MTVITSMLLLLFSFYALARLVDAFFVETLEIISKKLKLSSDIAGATFMAVGSSAPELFVSILALFKAGEGQSLGAGTIVGSAIFNILVIIGASALFKRAILTWQPVIRDLIFYVFCILLLLYTFIDGEITFVDSLMYLGVYVLYLASFYFWKKLFPYTVKGDDEGLLEDVVESEYAAIKKKPWTATSALDKVLSFFFFDLEKREELFFVNFLISVAFLAGLSHLMVESAVEVAHFLGISEVVIGLTILAAGTSIPDLLSSVAVAKKGKGDMAISNAVGSNIFDIAIGLGLPWLFVTGVQGRTVPVLTENLSSSIVLLFATVVALLFLLIVKRWEIGRYAGVLLIASYVFYVLTQIGLVSFTLCLNIGSGFCFGL